MITYRAGWQEFAAQRPVVVPLSRSAPEQIEEVRQLGDSAIPASGRQPSLGVVGAQPRARRAVLS